MGVGEALEADAMLALAVCGGRGRLNRGQSPRPDGGEWHGRPPSPVTRHYKAKGIDELRTVLAGGLGN